jgi:hypothetical protein
MSHPSDQVPTSRTTIPAIMRQLTFALGVADARAGRPFHRDFDLWHGNDQWGYERGRLWAVTAPRGLPLKRDGEINPDAVRYYHGDIL